MPRSPFVFNILDLRHERAEAKPVDLEASVDWRLDLSRVLSEPPLRADLELVPMSGGILIRGTVKVVVQHTCHRCLDEWDESMDVPVAQLYATDGDDDDDYVIDGPDIDLEPMIRDEVLLALPLLPTCREGCKGVVDGAESDLNTSTPDDDADFAASPFAVLKDLLDTGD